MTEPRFHAMPDGRRIAFRYAPGTSPALVFPVVPGMSVATLLTLIAEGFAAPTGEMAA